MPQKSRHDQIAFVRQGYLAEFLLVIEVIVVIITVATARAAKWHPFTNNRWHLLLATSIPATLSLLLAAGMVGGCRDMWMNATSTGGAEGVRYRDTDFFARRRMVFFYTGVNLSLVTLSVLIEQTGGLTSSPYTTIFFALVLTGQQLSRFKTQSSFLISIGILLVILMRVYEITAGLLPSPTPPGDLVVILMSTTFVACGMIANHEKNHNYLIESQQGLPTRAYIYCDAQKIWHYVIYNRQYRIDPILPSMQAAKGSKASEAQIRTTVENEVKSMYQAAGWGQPNFRWPDETNSNGFTVYFPANEAGMESDMQRSRNG